ncbi:ABC transporter permease [Spirochaeta isovalerica]|uniref:NitT/TauT family transport system permease protein n=1 Tax=Spirochaeta isovalerica TaxID=150 RepID=A0A841RD31_9SPIO|nr:ABC transporter permease subunit [Spirochaeta isovalerica]MBB6481925.1 NitT/TauT family transport system permease protein [Spirochaeta isovalerica]
MKSKLLSFISVAVLLILWKIVSLVLGAEIILPSPEKAFFALVNLMREESFLSHVLYTVKRGALGFILSAGLALVVGIAAGENRFFFTLIKPLLTVIKTVPVLSIVLLAIIWLSTENVPVFVCFLVVFPLISGNVIEGIRHVDPQLLEMARIYRVSKRRIILQIYIPSLIPYLLAGLSTAAGVTWKAVIAAEVISMPRFGIGTGMQFAQIQLDTAVLFAWTITAVIISAVTETLLLMPARFLPWRKGA